MSSALAELLDRRRDALEALPGVIGTAVGESAIHLYVTPDADAGRLRPEAERIVGGAPVELVQMHMPEAQPE